MKYSKIKEEQCERFCRLTGIKRSTFAAKSELKAQGGKPNKLSHAERLLMSMRKACELFRISRRVYYYQAQTSDDGDLQLALEKVAQRYPRYGYRKL